MPEYIMIVICDSWLKGAQVKMTRSSNLIECICFNVPMMIII